jgi:hypothetical protein
VRKANRPEPPLTCRNVIACWLVMQSHRPSQASTIKSAMPICCASPEPAGAPASVSTATRVVSGSGVTACCSGGSWSCLYLHTQTAVHMQAQRTTCHMWTPDATQAPVINSWDSRIGNKALPTAALPTAPAAVLPGVLPGCVHSRLTWCLPVHESLPVRMCQCTHGWQQQTAPPAQQHSNHSGPVMPPQDTVCETATVMVPHLKCALSSGRLDR